MCDDSLPVPCVVTVVQALGLPDVASGLLLKGVVQTGGPDVATYISHCIGAPSHRCTKAFLQTLCS